MITTEVVSEGKFLRMSLTAQALYMHLVANADDDGCVDAYTITRMIGAKEDDLLLLKEREYITVLDEKEYILWITNWQNFNWIDARYKEDSKHLPLLRAKVSGVQIVESTKKDYNKIRWLRHKESTAHVQHMGSTGDALVTAPLRKGKVRKDKENINKDIATLTATPTASADVSEEDTIFLEAWKAITNTTIRTKLPQNVAAAKRLKERYSPDFVKRMVETVRMIKADKYAGRNLQAVGNYIELEKNLEKVEQYRQGLDDRKSFTAATSQTIVSI